MVDAVGFSVNQLDDDNKDKTNVAMGYAFATALVPLMRSVDTSAADTVKTNLLDLGDGGSLDGGKDVVMNALKTFVTAANIDCDLLNVDDICNPVPIASTGTDPDDTPSQIADTTLDGGVSSGSNKPSNPLLSGAYIPTSDVDHM